MSNKLNNQISLLKDQQLAVEMEAKGREELLNQEISSLQDNNGKSAGAGKGVLQCNLN